MGDKPTQSIWICKSTDEEKRLLRLDVDRLTRALKHQQEKRKEIEKEANEWKRKYKEEQQINEKLKNEIARLTRQRDTYRSLLFKENSKPPQNIVSSSFHLPKRKRGGQPGHMGYGRTLPGRVDQVEQYTVSRCPDCDGKLTSKNSFKTHTVEDIPSPTMVKTIVTRYEITRQWCKRCKKEVLAQPLWIIPNSRLGLHLLVQVFIWKYECRMSMKLIVALLRTTYGVKISVGTLALCLRRTQQFFNMPYQDILAAIRAAPVKHADETGWRINGQNEFLWIFLTKKVVCYTIEETRGKGVPERILEHPHRNDILVRDDYAGYKNLPMLHQSCWAHMLRKSHEEVNQPTASHEMKLLHQQVKAIYATLIKEIAAAFNLPRRQKIYGELLAEINRICNTSYQADDAKRIQTRVANQREHLLTALLFKNVPLTNNLAERMIRPLVVQRKISGGSRSREGATAHAVNMSILQTLKLRKQPLMPALRRLIWDEANGYHNQF